MHEIVVSHFILSLRSRFFSVLIIKSVARAHIKRGGFVVSTKLKTPSK